MKTLRDKIQMLKARVETLRILSEQAEKTSEGDDAGEIAKAWLMARMNVSTVENALRDVRSHVQGKRRKSAAKCPHDKNGNAKDISKRSEFRDGKQIEWIYHRCRWCDGFIRFNEVQLTAPPKDETGKDGEDVKDAVDSFRTPQADIDEIGDRR
jgi:hypothetical protein